MSGRRRTGFRDGLILAGLLVLAVMATWPTWEEIFSLAMRSAEHSHILLVLPITAWLVWLRRERFRRVAPVWSWAGVAMVVGGLAAQRVGSAGAWDVGRHAGALLAVVGAAVTVLGVRTVLQFKPAAACLLFLVPVPGRIRQQIALPLQEVSARVSQFVLEIGGVEVQRMGNVLHINGADVAIAEACNGMRMVAALALIAFAFAFSVPMRNSVRLGLLALSPLVAIVVNVVRLVPTVLMYGYTRPDTAQLFHDVSGWVVLVLALGLLWLMLAALRWAEVPIEPYPVGRR